MKPLSANRLLRVSRSRMRSQRGDLSVGTNTALVGALTVIAIPIWAAIEGKWDVVGMAAIAGVALLALGYLFLKLEKPGKRKP